MLNRNCGSAPLIRRHAYTYTHKTRLILLTHHEFIILHYIPSMPHRNRFSALLTGAAQIAQCALRSLSRAARSHAKYTNVPTLPNTSARLHLYLQTKFLLTHTSWVHTNTVYSQHAKSRSLLRFTNVHSNNSHMCSLVPVTSSALHAEAKWTSCLINTFSYFGNQSRHAESPQCLRLLTTAELTRQQ